VCNPVLNVVEKLENMMDDEKLDAILPKEQKLQKWKDKLEEHKEKLKEDYELCRNRSNF